MKDMVRVGRVSSVNPDACSARVTFDDRSDLVSHELPVLVKGSVKNKDYWMPAPDEQVVCLFSSNGRSTQGFILGAVYSEKDAPPVTDGNKRLVSFSDGTVLEYDTGTHTLTIDAKGPINVVAAGSVNVTGDVLADGVSLKHHTHSGVTVGTANSGQPVGGA